MHSRLAMCVVLIVSCAMLAIPVSLPAHSDSNHQTLGHTAASTPLALSPSSVRRPRLEDVLIPERDSITETFSYSAGSASRCQPRGQQCGGPHLKCCPGLKCSYGGLRFYCR